jgi:WS/DGAT/MGAT family acyltransferase
VPGASSLLIRGVTSTALRSGRLLTQLPTHLPHLADLPGARNFPALRLVADLAGSAVSALTGEPVRPADARHLPVPPTPFNGPITAHRRFAFCSVDLAAAEQVRDAFGLTVLDVVMAMTTTALRRWLLDHDALPSIPLVTAVPVSVPADEGSDESGTMLSLMLARLPTNEQEPLARLHAVVESMAEAKAAFEAVPASIMRDLSAATPTALSGWAARSLLGVATAPSPLFNLFITSVPGPQQPQYMAGARVTGMYPVSTVSDMTGGMNITLVGYDGSLDVGIIVCREMVPDVWRITGYLSDALDELAALADA